MRMDRWTSFARWASLESTCLRQVVAYQHNPIRSSVDVPTSRPSLCVYSVHYGFYDYTVQYLEEFKAYIIAQGLVEKLGAVKEVRILPGCRPYD